MRILRVAGLLVAAAAVSLSAADGTLRVLDAVKQGNQAEVKRLITQRADVNVAEADGMTALHWAVRAADVPTVQLLVRAGAKVNAASRYGVTPIMLAAQNGDPVLVDALLKAGADANSALPEGETALMNAARAGNADAIKALVAHGARVGDKESWQGQTALMWAASRNNAAAVKILIEAGADTNERSKLLDFPDFKFETAGMVVTMLPRGGWTALMYAARDGAADAVRALADGKADLNATDPDGTTALMYAILNAHFDTAAALVEKGADPNVADIKGTTALYWAVDMHTMGTMMGRPAPKLVDTLDAADLVRMLIDHGANVNARLKRPVIGRHHTMNGDAGLGDGTTALARAAKGNDLQVMKMLLDAGADPKLSLKDRTTVLMLAAAGGAVAGPYQLGIPVTEASSIEAVKLFLDRGVDVNAFNTMGQTAMHLAVARGARHLVTFLAEHGAAVDVKNKQGRTPLDIALGVGSGFTRNNDVQSAASREPMAALLRELIARGASTGSAQPQRQ
jgi:ankyrin repeat protein